MVIIDEAHNIMDAVSSANAAAIKLGELRRARQMLGVYIRRFGKKLKGENRANIARVGRVIEGLSDWMAGALKEKQEQGIVESNVLLRHKSIDQINLFDLIKYIQVSKLAYKIESYVSHVEEQVASSPTVARPSVSVAKSSPSTPVLHSLLSFLQALTNLSFEGRIFFQKLDGQGDMELSYLLLSPTHAFSAIASKARAVILAGGTMSPFEDYTAHLFPSLSPEKITTLSCGHVIPPSNLCVWTLAKTTAKTPAGSVGETTFEFSFQKRGDKGMINQLGLVLLNISSVVPDGVVVFFPSYGYLDQVVQTWEAKPPRDEPSIWDRLAGKKTLFRETKGGSSDQVLEAYSAAILGDAPGPNASATSSAATPVTTNKTKGAILLSVVGGKMSEGINFSDRLGRLVLVIGLPFPNIHSPEWKAKTEYVEATTLSRLLDTAAPDDSSAGNKRAKEEASAMAKQAARDFYENACMRAVNQSIGRAIRHRGDYASIVLVDRRYGTERIRAKLPGWIKTGLVGDSHEKGLPQLMAALGGFFRGKKGT